MTTDNVTRELDYLRELTSDVVAAYVGNNAISTAEVPRLISQVYDSLVGLTDTDHEDQPHPAVPIAKSKTTSHLFCLEDGKKFRTLSRHLETAHGLSPEQYRAKWDLPRDYPMVAPAYSASRSAIAKGLHQRAAEARLEPAAAKVRRHQG